MLKRMTPEKRKGEAVKPEFKGKQGRLFKRERLTDEEEELVDAVKEPSCQEKQFKKSKPELRKKNAQERKKKKKALSEPSDSIRLNYRDKDNPLFYITPKRQSKALRFGVAYPVYAIDIDKQERLQNVLKGLKKLGKIKHDESLMDADDETHMDELTDKAKKEQAVVVWLLVGVKKKHRLAWVDAVEVFYL